MSKSAKWPERGASLPGAATRLAAILDKYMGTGMLAVETGAFAEWLIAHGVSVGAALEAGPHPQIIPGDACCATHGAVPCAICRGESVSGAEKIAPHNSGNAVDMWPPQEKPSKD